MAPAEFRYLLVSLATASHPRFTVSRFELDRPGVSYTVDTLEHLSEVTPPGTQLYFITGADAVLDILTWKDPGRVLQLATFIAATRPGYDLARLSGLLHGLRAETFDSAPADRVRMMEVPRLGHLFEHDQGAACCGQRGPLPGAGRGGAGYPQERGIHSGPRVTMQRVRRAVMTDDYRQPTDPAAPDLRGTPADDDPTLENETRLPDDEPTLETAEQAIAEQSVGEPTDEREQPRAKGWGARLEQMTVAKQQRRRQVITRFWLAAAPVLVIVGVAAVLLAVYGGQRGTASAGSTSTTAAVQQVAGSGLLLVEEDGALSWAVVLQPWDGGGVVLAVPGITLFESQGAFKTLAEISDTGGKEVVKAALAGALGVSMGPAVTVDRAELKAAAATTVTDATAAATAPEEQAEGETLAVEVKTLVSQYAPAETTGPWREAVLQGEIADFLEALRLDAAAMVDDVWTVGVLTGEKIEGDGFAYLEPDVEAAKSLLVVVVESTITTVEVKDGVGIEGAARLAGNLLESGGFVLAPMSYAAGYPSVERTQIVVSRESASQAQQVHALLGIGDIAVDETLAENRILVILGKDFSAVSR